MSGPVVEYDEPESYEEEDYNHSYESPQYMDETVEDPLEGHVDYADRGEETKLFKAHDHEDKSQKYREALFKFLALMRHRFGTDHQDHEDEGHGDDHAIFAPSNETDTFGTEDDYAMDQEEDFSVFYYDQNE